MKLRIATRSSPLARWQAEHVARLLRVVEPTLDIEYVTAATLGDRRLDLSIVELGGKGAFSKEIQQLVLAGHADVAVHSAKDLQALTPVGLVISAFVERGDPRDALVGARLVDLPAGASVATGSNRRGVLLLDQRPDLELRDLRGNIQTRLAQSGRNGVDAVVVAAVALERLSLQPEVVDILDPTTFVPQVGQGALAVEAREDDDSVRHLLATINHHLTATAVGAERSFLAELGGDCNLPAGAHATVNGDAVEIRGVLAPDAGTVGRRGAAPTGLHRAIESGSASADPGRVLARRLRKAVETAAA